MHYCNNDQWNTTTCTYSIPVNQSTPKVQGLQLKRRTCQSTLQSVVAAQRMMERKMKHFDACIQTGATISSLNKPVVY